VCDVRAITCVWKESFQSPVTIVGCLHTFCDDCLDFWLRKSEDCPLCKLRVDVYISADPQRSTHRLYTRADSLASPTPGTRPLLGGGPVTCHRPPTDPRAGPFAVPGLSDAIRIQAAVHEKLHSVSPIPESHGKRHGKRPHPQPAEVPSDSPPERPPGDLPPPVRPAARSQEPISNEQRLKQLEEELVAAQRLLESLPPARDLHVKQKAKKGPAR
jgi:hypothetical protein